MIKDLLKNATTYYPLSKRLEAGFEWLKNTDLKNIADGKYLIDGENLFANVQTYETKEDALFESHRRYIDIQYMVKGIEKIGVSDYSNCSTKVEYDSEKDIEFMTSNSNSQYQLLNEGDFIVLYPQDAHKPSISVNDKLLVKKVVVKVLI